MKKDYKHSKTNTLTYNDLLNINIDLYNYKHIQSCIDNYLDISNDYEGFFLLQDRYENNFKAIFEENFNYFTINYN